MTKWLWPLPMNGFVLIQPTQLQKIKNQAKLVVENPRRCDSGELSDGNGLHMGLQKFIFQYHI